jgi:uncharacterized membrane protein YkvA (DUF1232 family)
MKMPFKLMSFLPLAKRYLAAGRLPMLLFAASRKSLKNGIQLGSVTDDLKLLLELGNAWWRGEYRAVSPQALLAVVAALLYFVSPLDAVPDWLLGVGFLDDIAVFGWLMSTWKGELQAFRDWRATQPEEVLGVVERVERAG